MAESVSGDEVEIETTHIHIPFRDAKKSLKINTIEDLKNLPEFTNIEEVHRSILNTVINRFLGRNKLSVESDWQNMGFANSQEILNCFKNSNGLFLLLHLLFHLESDPIDFEQSQFKQLLIDCNKISERLVELLKLDRIPSISKFFIYFSSAVHYLKPEEIHEMKLEEFQELVNKRIFEQINF